MNVPTIASGSDAEPPVELSPPLELAEPPVEPGVPPVEPGEPPVPEPPVVGTDVSPPVAAAGSFVSDEHPKAAAAALTTKDTWIIEEISIREWRIRDPAADAAATRTE